MKKFLYTLIDDIDAFVALVAALAIIFSIVIAAFS